jgi:D-sedoheptulose 7-phosphate isomerase
VRISTIIRENIAVKEAILEDKTLLERIQRAADICTTAFQQDKKVLFCGNGGSAADAQHIAAEFSGRFYRDRAPLFAEALHVNTSYLTAVANDYSFEVVYARMVEAMGREGDVLFGISTSGNSKNIVAAMKKAQEKGLFTIALTGNTGGQLKRHCDLLLHVPSDNTPRIQEAHIMIGHIVCELVENSIFAS